MIKARVYHFNYGLIWLGWVFETETETTKLYYDNNPIYNFVATDEIKYLCIGLSKKKVISKLRKFCKRRYGN